MSSVQTAKPRRGLSEVERTARNHRRRILRRLGRRACDLDAITLALVDEFVKTSAHRDALASDSERRWTATNSTARALARLEARLREVGLDRRDPTAELRGYLEATYKDGNGDSGD